jgi:hypothetical protein
LREAQIVIESWRNTIRPHASIGYKPPAPEVFVPAFAAWPAALRRRRSAMPGCEIHRTYLSAIEQSERNISIGNIATLRRD